MNKEGLFKCRTIRAVVQEQAYGQEISVGVAVHACAYLQAACVGSALGWRIVLVHQCAAACW